MNSNPPLFNTTHDEETISLIKIQNKKLTSLFTQLDNKDKQITELQSKLSSLSTLHHHNQTLQSLTLTQNNKINDLLTRINDLNIVISNQDNTINVLSINKASIEEKSQRDYETLHKELQQSNEECRRLTNELHEKTMVIENYQSKLSQCEYLLNDKQNYNEDYEKLIDSYEANCLKVIDWAKGNIGIKERGLCCIYQAHESIEDSGIGGRFTMINDTIVKALTAIHQRVNEEYSQYEKELETQQNSYSNSIEQIKEMNLRIKLLERENVAYKERLENDQSQFASNSVHYKQEIQSMHHSNSAIQSNIDGIIEDFLRQYIEDYSILTSMKASELFLPTIQHVKLSKETNQLKTIASLLSQLMEYCKWLINDTHVHYKSHGDYELLSKDNKKLKEANESLKKTLEQTRQQYAIEKEEICKTLSQSKEREISSIEKALNEEVSGMKIFLEDYQEENERLAEENKHLKRQCVKIEKSHEEYKKNQGEYEGHMQLMNEDLTRKVSELEGIIMKLRTDLEIGHMQMGSLKNALQEQINMNEQTRETMTNYTTTHC